MLETTETLDRISMPEAARALAARLAEGLAGAGGAAQYAGDAAGGAGAAEPAAGCIVGPEEEYRTVQSALDDPGCRTIVVTDGAYVENLVVHRDVNIIADGKVTLSGTGDGVSSAVVSIRDADVVLDSLTIEGGEGVDGGGVASVGGTLILQGCVVENNSALRGAGVYVEGALEVSNTTVRENTITPQAGSETTLWLAGAGLYVDGQLTMNDSTIEANLIEAAADDGWAPLADNGGFSETHALTSDSSAVDAGDPAGCKGGSDEPLELDQRGEPRSAGGRCDIGAHERQ